MSKCQIVQVQSLTSLFLDVFKNNSTQMLTLMRQSVALNNSIYAIKVVVRLRGQMSKLAKTMFVQTLTLLLIDRFYMGFTFTWHQCFL